MRGLKAVELCAGAGGQALGLEAAGFDHLALVDIDPHCYETLRYNRPGWNVVQGDIRDWPAEDVVNEDLDLLAAGLPCPPFSVAGKKLGNGDERDLFPHALSLIERLSPKAVMIENVKGFLDPKFDGYRHKIFDRLHDLGYSFSHRVLQASDYGVPQLRPRLVVVALRHDLWNRFLWPEPLKSPPPTVGDALYDLMTANGWKGADAWRENAQGRAPTIVGGSHKHGGPDLGPTRAKQAWAALGVNGHSIAESAPEPDFKGAPRLTVPMVARLQGFPGDWVFAGKKTAAYRQVGNAFPPPVASAVAEKIALALAGTVPSRMAV